MGRSLNCKQTKLFLANVHKFQLSLISTYKKNFFLFPFLVINKATWKLQSIKRLKSTRSNKSDDEKPTMVLVRKRENVAKRESLEIAPNSLPFRLIWYYDLLRIFLLSIHFFFVYISHIHLYWARFTVFQQNLRSMLFDSLSHVIQISSRTDRRFIFLQLILRYFFIVLWIVLNAKKNK